MSRSKTRILWCGESSFLPTGFGTFSKEMLERFSSNKDLEVAEIACFSMPHHDGSKLPWQYFPASPTNKEKEQWKNAAYGEAVFDEVCKKFKPDICCDVRDHWNNYWQEYSPARKFFKWMLLPTVDSAPQQRSWMKTFTNADFVLPQNQYGIDTLTKQGNGFINIPFLGSMGVDYNTFYPKNKASVRQKYGIPENATVFGTVMRNQARKLYPELIKCFCQANLGKEAYLLLHFTNPPGWNISNLIRDNGNNANILMTYVCAQCGELKIARHCGCVPCDKCSIAMIHPNTSHGLSREKLADVYNCMDVYCQHSVGEGFGVPAVEAAASGIPIMAVDYSAMSDIVHKLKGWPIKVAELPKDYGTYADRAVPDSKAFIAQLQEINQEPKTMLAIRGNKARQIAIKEYNYDNTYDNIMKCLEMPKKSVSEPWNFDLDNDLEFVLHNVCYVANRPDIINGFYPYKLYEELQSGKSNRHGVVSACAKLKERYENFIS